MIYSSAKQEEKRLDVFRLDLFNHMVMGSSNNVCRQCKPVSYISERP